MKKKNNKINNQEVQAAAEVQHINLSQIETGNNPRKFFDETALQELSESIKQVGIIQPITVRPSQTEGFYSIICGERRYRASQIAGLETIPVYIRNCTDEQALDMAITENIQREDMTELETAEVIKTLLEQKNLPYAEIAVKLGKSEKYIRDRYVLNNLIDPFKEELNTNQLTVGKAVLLASYPQDLQEHIFDVYFSEDNYQYCGNYPLQKLKTVLEDQFNNNLTDAIFDISDCQQCKFNSNFGMLFTEEQARCLNPVCYKEKYSKANLNNLTQELNKNPDYKICKKYYADPHIEAHLNEHNFEISDINGNYFPEEPIKPIVEDYTDDETGETDEEEYQNDLEIYQNKRTAYENKLVEIQTNLEDGIYQPCYILNGSYVRQGYFLPQEEKETDNEQAEEQQEISSNSEIIRLQKQLTREQELKVEKTISDIKDSHFKGNVDFNNEATKLEQDALFYYLLSELSDEHKQVFFDGEIHPSDKQKFDFILTMSKEHQIIIIRDFILSKMRSLAYDSYSVSSQLFLEFSKLHFPEETQKIEQKHYAVFKKRQHRINEKLLAFGIKNEQDETKEDKEQVPEEVTK